MYINNFILDTRPKINLPHGHISWSQLDLWDRSRGDYIKKYFYGQELPVSREMVFGKKFSTAMETGKTDDHSIKAVMPSVPTYEIAEYKIETILETEHGNIHLIGYLDRSRRDPLNGFREYKTGKSPWTQRKADSNGQITFYNLMIYLKTGKLPPNVNIDWIQTAELEGKIYLTGQIATFSTTRTMQEVVEMANRVKRATLEISEQYNYYLFQAV